MDVFDLVAKITLDSSDYEKQVKAIADDADENKGGWIGKLAGGLGKVGKVGATAFGIVGAASAAAVGALAKSAVSSYAEYEQLAGGVQKLFGKEASAQVMKYAENAYKTSGMSANEYMETATGFSASLIQSLGGDTKKAAEVADVAMRAMSDNVNTFGGDIEGVKSAYMGFAKQNYTMLDNLKLGYGGTKTEMERLIKDANKYRKEQGKTADLTIDSYADIIEAIQTVQEEQGIAGTTAKESMTTIEGSATATKAAWKNVLTAIAGGGDLKKAMKGLSSAIFGEKEGEGLLNQVIPRIQTAIEGVGQFVTEAIPQLAKKIPELITKLVPPLLTAAGSLAKSVASSIPSLLKGIWEAIKATAPILISTVKDLVSGIPGALGGIVSSISNWVSTNASTIAEKGGEIWGKIKEGITSGVEKAGEALANLGTTILNWINGKGLQDLKDNGGELWDKIKTGFTEALSDIGQLVLKIVTGIGTWITKNYKDIAQAGQTILSYIVEGIVAVASDIATGLLSMIKAAGTWLVNNYQSIFDIGKKVVGYIIEGIVNAVKTIAKGFVDFITNIGSWFSDNESDIKGFGEDVVGYIKSGITNKISTIKEGFSSLVGNIRTAIASKVENLKSIGANILGKIKDGISGAIGNVKDGLKDLASELSKKVTSLADKLKAVGGKIISGIKAGITGAADIAEKVKTVIQNGITQATSTTYKATVKVGTKVVKTGGIETDDRFQAKALHQPYLFNKATIFGKYQGDNLVAGEAGPEMLLGVNKLNAMLFQSVQGGMQSMMGQMYQMVSGMQTGGGSEALQREILNVLNTYFPQVASMQVVLDTGAVAGAVASGVDSELGNLSTYKGRYNA